MHNWFFALWPDPATRARLVATAGLLREAAPRGRWLKPERYHLTLQFLGTHAEVPGALLSRWRRCAGELRVAQHELTLDLVGSFPGRKRVVWLGCRRPPAELLALVEGLSRGLAGACAEPGSPPRFVPHLTVLRDAEAALDASLTDPVRWPVRDFVLVASSLQPPAPCRIVGRWRLRKQR